MKVSFALALLLGWGAAAAAERIDPAVISAIRYEGLQGSHVMDHLTWLADVHGPRITGTPEMLKAGEWTMQRLRSFGLSEVRREHWKFGPGWAIRRIDIRMIEPQSMQVIGYPFGWSPGTKGSVTAEVVHPMLRSEADFAAWRGKLRGRIVLTQPARTVQFPELPLVQRFSDEDLERFSRTPVPWQWLTGEGRDGRRRGESSAPSESERLLKFLQDEGAVAIIERGDDSVTRPAGAYADLTPAMTQIIDGGTIITPSARGQPLSIPRVCIAVEQYNRVVRVLQLGVAVKMTLDIEVEFYPEGDPPNGFNILADLPGSDLKRESVILGAHFDSVPTATGAVDNAAGVAIGMEAMRLLARTGVKPRRTIRLGLWGGEETGMLGSLDYVTRQFGDPLKGGPYSANAQTVSAYFNVDNGSGRIRGLFLRHNLAAEPVLARWLEPLHDLGATTLARHAPPSLLARNNKPSSGSDHLLFDATGIPAFEMIQDRLDYFSRTAHSNMDYADRASKEGMVQASVVLAVLAYQAAMSDERVPRRAPPAALGSSVPR